MYTDFLFPFEKKVIHAYRYYNFGKGTELEESFWKGFESSAKLKIHRKIGPVTAAHAWPSTTCSILSGNKQTRTCESTTNTLVSDESLVVYNDIDELNDVSDQNIPTLDESESAIFDCPEDGCIAKFMTYGRLVNHILRGVHELQPERVTMKDYALGLYSAHIENVQMDRIFQPLQDVIQEIESTDNNFDKTLEPLPQGWALPQKKTKTEYTDNVKTFLKDLFVDGEKTKRKFDPKQVAIMMESITVRLEGEDRPRFMPSELLNYRQIASYFSRKTARMRNVAGCIENPKNVHCNEIHGFPDTNEEGEPDLEFTTDPLFPDDHDELMTCVEDTGKLIIEGGPVAMETEQTTSSHKRADDELRK